MQTQSAPQIEGRLGLVNSRIPHVDRHGMLFLSRGSLSVNAGSLIFECAEYGDLEAGLYGIPYQQVSMICIGPGSSVTHDALRLMSAHGTSLVAIGDGGVKFYSAPPFGKASSEIARLHAQLWANEKTRLDVARRMYGLRFGKILPHRDIAVLRGIEGAKVKEAYKMLGDKYGIDWERRKYDRANPDQADIPNQAINHAATFVESAAEIAVAATGALPPLGFIHEDSSNAFTLDIADLYRTAITIPIAFKIASKAMKQSVSLEREIRYAMAAEFRSQKVISKMIDNIKTVLKP